MPLVELSTPTISVESSTLSVRPRSRVMLLLSWSTRETRPRMCCTLTVLERSIEDELLFAIEPVPEVEPEVLPWAVALPMSLAVPVWHRLDGEQQLVLDGSLQDRKST